MAVTVNKLDYIYKKLLNEAKSKMNDTVEISDEEYGIIYEGNDKPAVDPSEEHDYSQDYLTFEALEDGTFSFTVNDLYYSTNNGSSWKSLAAGTETELITAGTKVLLKGDNQMQINHDTGYYGTMEIGMGHFSSTNKFNISGNILSLIYPNNLNTYDIYMSGENDNEHMFASLFKNCENLIDASNLILFPTILSESCYSEMFKNCKALIKAPKLPATTLRPKCYNSMFEGCTSLIKAPELLVTKLNLYTSTGLEIQYYVSMFSGCSSLNYIKCLAENIKSKNISGWVNNVSSSGIFIKNSKATFNIGNSGIPAGWEVIDEEVPEE